MRSKFIAARQRAVQIAEKRRGRAVLIELKFKASKQLHRAVRAVRGSLLFTRLRVDDVMRHELQQ